MTIDEIKVGTKFKYVGSGWNHHKKVIQTITRIDGGVIYTDLKETGYVNGFFFHIGSNYTRDCKIIQPPSVDTMKKEFTYKGLDFKCTIEFNTSEKIVQYQIVNLHKITIEDGLGRLKLSTESDYNNLPQHILKLENTVKYYVDYVHNIKEKDSIQQLLKYLGFSE